ncbi:MAG: carbamoyltransferase N-terminal domain-containing protein, partial [Methylococcales bacterium]
MTWSPKIFIEASAWRAYLKNAEGININKNNSYQLLEKLLALLILVNVLAVILESVSSLSAEYALVFMQLRQYSYAVFVLEYGIRIYCCVVSHSTQSKQLFATLRRIFSPIMVVDFLVISLFYLKIQLGFDLRLLRLFRVLYILEVLRNSAALHILQSIFVRERKTLLSLALIMIVLVIFEAAIIYVLENPVQPEVFSSIPEAMWWTLTTLTTVGYGDVVPITPLGKLFGVIVMFVGIGMFAVPTGILISAFYHDSAVALVIDGEIVAAAQEERFTRKKHDPSYPVNAINYCLSEAGLSLRQIDYIAFYDKPFLKFERLLETYVAFAPKGFQSFRMAMPIWLREKLFLKDM